MKTKTELLTFGLPRFARNDKRAAFTLAEVLITLAIIGVVATMTIPTLIANYQERSWNTSATVFDRKLTEALKIMNSQSSLAGHKTTENFVKELSKHLKIVRTCDNSNLTDCFVDSMTMRENTITVDLNNISTSADLGQSEWDTNIVGIQLANGTNALVAYNPNCKQDPYSNQITGSDCLAIMYDTTGFKSPNHLSKDLRVNANVKNIDSKLVCAFEIGETCFGAPFYPTAVTKAECEEMISTHGINECAADNDYWAGAVKTCGHVNNLPDADEMAKLAEYIYDNIGTVNPTPGSITYCPYNADSTARLECKEDATSLGFANSFANSSFYVYLNDECSSNHARYRGFAPTQTDVYCGNRIGDRDLQAVCVAE